MEEQDELDQMVVQKKKLAHEHALKDRLEMEEREQRLRQDRMDLQSRQERLVQQENEVQMYGPRQQFYEPVDGVYQSALGHYG